MLLLEPAAGLFILSGSRREMRKSCDDLRSYHERGLWPIRGYEVMPYDYLITIHFHWQDSQVLIDFLREVCDNEGWSVENATTHIPTPVVQQLALPEPVEEVEVVTPRRWGLRRLFSGL